MSSTARSKRNLKKKKRQDQPRKRGPKYWVTIGTVGAMIGYAAVDHRRLTPVYAQVTYAGRLAVYSPDHQQNLPVVRFDIPPGTLEGVLAGFERLTGLRVLIPNEAVRDISSPGVSGVYTAEQALKQLLAGTGTIYRFTSTETVVLELEGPSSSIEVKGEASNISSPKYTEPMRDIPQTIVVIPNAVIEQQGATTLRDVLRNVPGLTIAAGEGGTPAGDNLTLRGFSARNDVFIDGVRDLSPQSRDPFNLEQVEVSKGPGSVYNGRGSTGGTINLVSKSPVTDASYGFGLNLGTDRTRRVTSDLNLPLARLGLGERSAFRLNLLGHESNIAGRDVVENRRWGVAPSLAFGLGTPTRVTVSYFKLSQDNLSDYGIPWVPATNNALREFRDRPAPVPRDTFYGLSSRDFEKLDSDLATVRVEHDFDDAIRLQSQLRYGHSTRDSIATPPRFASNDSTAINRELRSWITADTIWDSQTDLNARFSTGAVGHSLVSGIQFARENNQRRNRTAPNMLTTLLNPNPDDRFQGAIITSSALGDITADSLAVYAFDTVRLGEKFELNGGLRWDYFDVEGVTVALLPITRIDRLLSMRAGAVYKPVQGGSIYLAYGTSLNPSLEGLSYATANTAIEPEKTYNIEVGSKWDLLNRRLLLTGALFSVNKTNARTPGVLPDDPPQVLEGRQRVNGVELGATGTITRNWSVFAAYTYLDSEIRESNTPAEVGKALINTPKNSISFWSTHLFLQKLNVGGGARFVDKRFGNTTNTRQVPGYWLVDAVASYPLTPRIDLRLNLYNLTDEYYFDRIGGGHLVPGPGRSVSVSAGFRF